MTKIFTSEINTCMKIDEALNGLQGLNNNGGEMPRVRKAKKIEKITAGKLSQAVTHQIEELILRGILRPGERLPSERDLAERMGVSRPSLREAIADLQEKGLLSSRAGAGIFVADVLGNAFSPALVSLFSEHDAAVFDYVAFRRDMEGLAAERAARLGIGHRFTGDPNHLR